MHHMSKKQNWEYSNADHHRCGLMICVRCNLKIEEGPFKFFKDNVGYFRGHHHMACSLEDTQWVVLAAKDVKTTARAREYLDAMIVFRDRWQTTALDDEIEEYATVYTSYQDATRLVKEALQ